MKIIGTGSATAEKVVTNDMLAEFLDTSDEWITQRTGIRSRHIISHEELSDLAATAVSRALEMSGLRADEIDFLICSNVMNEYITPNLGSIVATKLGFNCPSVDINAACPGFVYALDIAENRWLAGKAKNIVIVCAEEPSRMCDWNDRSTCVLFGDGAGAVVLTGGDNIKGIKLTGKPDPDKIWERRVLEPTPYVDKTEENVPLKMNGREVFRFAVSTSTSEVEALLSEVGVTKDQVCYYMIHQANMRIIDAIKNYLGEPEAKFPTNIQDHGNSSSASCPILLDECNRKGLFKKGDIIVFSAFGAGLLSGAAVMEW